MTELSGNHRRGVESGRLGLPHRGDKIDNSQGRMLKFVNIKILTPLSFSDTFIPFPYNHQ